MVINQWDSTHLYTAPAAKGLAKGRHPGIPDFRPGDLLLDKTYNPEISYCYEQVMKPCPFISFIVIIDDSPSNKPSPIGIPV